MNHTEVRRISTKTVQSTSPSSQPQQIDLSPWDLKFLKIGVIQIGLLYHYQPTPTTTTTTSIIQSLETSLSLTLHHFYPLVGRLSTTAHDDNTISVYIDCNNAGVELIHAIAPSNVTVADIKNPIVVPNIVHDFFPLNGSLNCDPDIPLLAVQATELVDGVFIGVTMNHAAVDGTSFWHFINTWSEICRTGSDHFISAYPPKVFHFSQESIARLKAKANAEQPKTLNNTPIKISSLQAVLAHIWLAVTRARRLPSDEKTSYVFAIGNRTRLVPPLPNEYLGSAMSVGTVAATVGELLEEGIGWAAALLNQEINAHNDGAIRGAFSSWVKKPVCPSLADFASNFVLLTGSSPRFNVYGNDFGWGRPVGVRSGGGNKFDGKVTVFEGCVEGSMDFEACLAIETLKALVDDAEFMGE
ncbi:hypothetical protein Syun_015270 [Stephania yunnanensis]|uniref:Uncharacterized protein n=1 Tax=Stephania yunnanensis TaxID=152371 RepID=A0AAP0PCQ9_9MAGN